MTTRSTCLVPHPRTAAIEVFANLSASLLDRREGVAAIGVDVGGTKLAFGLLDASSLALLARSELPTRRERGGQAVLDDVETEAAAFARRATELGRRVVGIGIGVPEIVDLDGRITTSGVIPQWDGLPIGATLAAVAPAHVEADVRAAAFAEAMLGAGRDFRYFLFLTLGTGISFSAVWDGRPIAGARGGALNIGTSVLSDRFVDDPEAQPLVLEQIASGSALVERYVARGGKARRAEDVLAAVKRGDEKARAVVDEGAKALGIGVALLVNLFDPEAVVVGGGLGSADTLYGPLVEEWARSYMHSEAASSIPIRRAQLGPDAGVIGAGLVGLVQQGDARHALPDP
jgi:glucokinase